MGSFFRTRNTVRTTIRISPRRGCINENNMSFINNSDILRNKSELYVAVEQTLKFTLY